MKKIGMSAALALLAVFACCRTSYELEGKYPYETEETPGEVDEPDVPEDIFKILFIGNSLTLDATTLLPDMLNAAGIRNVEMTRIFHGAYTLPLYNENYSVPGICSMRTWKPGMAMWSSDETFGYSPQQAVEAEEYDLICIQEYSGNSCAWQWTENEKSAVNGLIEKIRKSQKDNNPEFAFMFSHTFGTGMERLVENFDNDNTKQFEACAETISHILEETGIEKVVSTAAVIQNLRTTGLNHEYDLTRGDLTHLDYGLGRYAAACVVFKSLITPVTGAKIEDNPFRFSEYYPHGSLYTTPVTDENVHIVFKAVEAACEAPLEITDMSEYSQKYEYEHKPDLNIAEKYSDMPEGCTFPVTFKLGDGAVDSYLQPQWSGYGIWVSTGQEQAYARWKIASYPIPEMPQTRTWASNGVISSVALRGVWTGDYMEFMIPVDDLPAGTTVRFDAPFYTRQGPIFWIFEWYDSGVWKSNVSDISSWDGNYTRNASFAIGLGTTYITREAVFENALHNEYMRLRIRCADGAVQADSSTKSSVWRELPNHTDTDLSSVFYFYGAGEKGRAITISIVE